MPKHLHVLICKCFIHVHSYIQGQILLPDQNILYSFMHVYKLFNHWARPPPYSFHLQWVDLQRPCNKVNNFLDGFPWGPFYMLLQQQNASLFIFQKAFRFTKLLQRIRKVLIFWTQNAWWWLIFFAGNGINNDILGFSPRTSCFHLKN